MTRRPPLAAVTPYPAETAARYVAAGHWIDETVDEYLRTAVAPFGDRTAAIGRSAATGTDTVWSYRDLDTHTDRWAARLQGAGVEPGDRVVVQLPNVVEYLAVVAGILRRGALPVFALPAHGRREIGQFCRLTDAAGYVVADRTLAKTVVAELSTAGHTPPAVLSAHETDDGTAPVESVSRRDPLSTALLQLSGGTTGVPKLIPRTHADYLYSVRASAELCGVDEDTVLLVVLPASHNFAMSSPGWLSVLGRGGTVMMAPDARPRTAFRLIQDHRVTMASLVPPLAQAWLAAAHDRYDLSTLTVVQVGGARLADSVAGELDRQLDLRVQQVFGMAEGLVNYTRLDDPDELRHTTQGRPISPDDEIRVVDEHDRPVPDGQEGQLLTRGPYTIRGYLGGVSADSFTDDGFYRTGDLVRQLPSGHLRVTGRVKDQINRGGEKIAVVEVEELLLQHPAVHDVAVVGLPDPDWGEISCAFIVPARPVVPGALREHLHAAGLATFKIPDRFRLLDAFPATGVGKTSRRDLRTLLATLPHEDET